MSFLRDYEIFTEGNEAHPTYHVYCALAALSSIVSRRVWVEMGYFQVHAGIYVILVGPPGNRKTTAMGTCKDLLRALKDIPFSAECITKEKLVQDLAFNTRNFKLSEDEPPIKYTPLTICVTELSQFLGAASAHMVDFLTTIYDENFYDLKTKNKGSERIDGPYIVLLACTTPAWITARLRDDVISGGFSRRALFVYETGKSRKIAFPEIKPEAKEAWTRLLDYSQQLMKVKGPFVWDSPAREFYEKWYISLDIPKEATIAGYYETKHTQLLKVAMLVALSESLELVLRKEHLQVALEMLKLIESRLARVFEGLGRNELNSIASDICEMLQGGQLPEKEIQKIMYRQASGDELYKVVQHLISTDRIERLQLKGTEGKPTRYFLRLKV